MSPVSPSSGLPMATAAALRGQRVAEARAADAAARLVLSGTAPNHDLSRALVQAMEAAPDALRALTDLHQATLSYKANAAVLRGANAAAAALLRWTA
jgi:hypothetical protein